MNGVCCLCGVLASKVDKQIGKEMSNSDEPCERESHGWWRKIDREGRKFSCARDCLMLSSILESRPLISQPSGSQLQA